ncbi:MAG: pyridoxal phosphate-dependent aminotransferase [Bacteroidia bacterium]|jgi:methionine aminotransferase|nr:pyridoxal phosphate-dependent aminotransferase [Bacteroidia bacterium]
MPDYSGTLGSKLPRVGTTIFTVMSRMAAEHNAINLSQGFPDFGCPPELLKLVTKAMKDGHNQYAPMPGLPRLRQQLAAKTEALYGTAYDPETEITVTSGATQAIYTAIAATIREGDEVIIFEPAYDCYEPAIELNGGKTVYAQLNAPDFHIDWEAVKKLINHHTRMIIVNTPHNPTGAVLSDDDMQQLISLTKKNDIIILADEVYEHMVFDGQPHQSMARYPELASRSFIVSSFGKTFHTTGWKLGYCIAPRQLMAEFRKVHQFLVFSCNTPMQVAVAEFLDHKDHYLELSAFYQQKRDTFNNLLRGSRFKLTPSAGTYFQLLDYSGITDAKDTDYAVELLKTHGVASIPVSVFYHKPVYNNVLRFCFAKKDETLEAAAEKLCKV